MPLQLCAVLCVVLVDASAGNTFLHRHLSPIANAVVHQTKLGVISYWEPSTGYYDTLPNGSMAVINPMNGIFADQSLETLAPGIDEFHAVVTDSAVRGIKLLGYVPTGYFNHACNVNGHCQTLERIETQVAKYFEVFPGLAGIFFDEIAPLAGWGPGLQFTCDSFVSEFEALRQLVRRHNSTATIAWNAAVTSLCPVHATNTGEVLVLYENGVEHYGDSTHHDILNETASAARSKGVETWHLVHTVSTSQMQMVIEKARLYQVDWFYATEIGGHWQEGENTWGSPPAYWDQLKYEFGWNPQPLELTAVIYPPEIVVGSSVSLTLNRPAAQCCNAYDWVGIYEKGSSERIGYVHSNDGQIHTVSFPLDALTSGLGEGEYEFKYSTSVDEWIMHDLDGITLKIHSNLFARVVPSEILVGSSAARLTLGRPAAQCCVGWDWLGIYSKGSVHRIAFIHSDDGEHSTVTLPLHNLIAGLNVGDYEFKYSTSVDGWVVHHLIGTTLKIHNGIVTTIPTQLSARVVPAEISFGGSGNLTLSRPAAQCCSAWDWIGIYEKGSGGRLNYIHSDNGEDHNVTLPLDDLIIGLSDGEYEFKYSTSVDGWFLHDLAPATLIINR